MAILFSLTTLIGVGICSACIYYASKSLLKKALKICLSAIGVAYNGFILVSILMILLPFLGRISNGVTTNESLRKKWNPSTFDQGCSKNWRWFCKHSKGENVVQRLKGAKDNQI